MEDIIDPIKDFSYEVDNTLKHWDLIHDGHKRGHKIENLDGINHIYLVCFQCKQIFINDTFGEEI